VVSSSLLVEEPLESSWHLHHHSYVQYAQVLLKYLTSIFMHTSLHILLVSDIAIFVLKRDVKLQLTLRILHESQ